MDIDDEMIGRLKAIGLTDRQMFQVWAIIDAYAKDAEVLRGRREKDREAHKAKRDALKSSKEDHLKKSEISADILRQGKERAWWGQLETFARTGEWPYKSPRPGTGGCEIPREFIEEFDRSQNAQKIAPPLPDTHRTHSSN